MSPSISRVLAVVAVALALGSPVAAGTQASPTADELQAAAEERAVFGLPSDEATVAALLTSGQDVGTERWGIPLTADEEAALDLPGRMAFANAIHSELIPYLEALPTFGGVYIDQMRDGDLVVLLAGVDPDAEAKIGALVPPGNREVHIQYVATPQSTLRSAAARAWDVWPRLAAPIELRAVGVDVAGNQLRVYVAPADVADAGPAAVQLARGLAVAVRVQPAEDGAEAACTDRDHCTIPMKAGIRIRKGSQYSEYVCTMNYHIVIGANEQFLTAGHCGYSGSNDWYHIGYGANKVGSELGTLYQEDGQDAMRVEMPDAQADDQIYGVSSNIVGWRNPVQGEAICASLGKSNAVDCGTVNDDYLSWISSTCGCTVWGADANGIAIIGGDSGSPISVGEIGLAAVAVGLVNTLDGHFARIDDVVDAFGAQLVT